MRKLNKAELLEIKEAMFNGRQWNVEVEDFDIGEYTLQLDRLEKGKEDKDDDAELSATQVGRRSASSS